MGETSQNWLICETSGRTICLMRNTLLILSLCALASCTHPSTPYGRDMLETDAQCMRRALTAPNMKGPIDFDMAASVCVRTENLATHSVYEAKNLPLDLRADQELQAMAENPNVNVSHRAFVPRDSKTPLQKWPVFSNQGVVQ